MCCIWARVSCQLQQKLLHHICIGLCKIKILSSWAFKLLGKPSLQCWYVNQRFCARMYAFLSASEILLERSWNNNTKRCMRWHETILWRVNRNTWQTKQNMLSAFAWGWMVLAPWIYNITVCESCWCLCVHVRMYTNNPSCATLSHDKQNLLLGYE